VGDDDDDDELVRSGFWIWGFFGLCSAPGKIFDFFSDENSKRLWNPNDFKLYF